MAKKLKNIDELLAWFKLENYEAAKDLDAAGWYEQLIIRKRLLDDFPKDENEIISLIREQPIVKMEVKYGDRLWSLFYTPELADLKKFRMKQTTGIQPMSLLNFLDIKSQLSNETVADIEMLELSHQYHDIELSFKPELLHRPIQDSSFNSIVATSIDLSFTNADLKKRFNKYLKEMRVLHKYPNPSKIYRPVDFGDWCDLGVLPYLDLQIWEKEETRSISKSIITDKILAASDKDLRTLEKTSKKLMTTKTLDILLKHARCNVNTKK